MICRRTTEGPAATGASLRLPGKFGDDEVFEADAFGRIEGPDLALSTTLESLLKDGSDRDFRQLIYNLLSLSNVVVRNREQFAAYIGMTHQQYVIMTILYENPGVTVTYIASQIHVSSQFVTLETGKLIKKGIVDKQPNEIDRYAKLSIYAMSLAISLFITILVIYNGFQGVDPDKIKLARTFGASRWQILTEVVLPGSVPTFIAALKVTAGLSLVGVVVGEFQSASVGLGYLIQYGSQTFKMNIVMTAIVVLAIVSVLMYFAIDRLETFVMRRR